MARLQTYTEEQKAVALEAVNQCGGKVAEAARQIGVAESTLRDWTRGHCVSEEVFAAFAAKKAGRATAKLRALVDRLADSIADEDVIAAASLQQRATTLGILVDKVRLMDGAPTQITRHEDAAALAELRQKAEEAIAVLMADNGWDRPTALATIREMAPTLSEYVN